MNEEVEKIDTIELSTAGGIRFDVDSSPVFHQAEFGSLHAVHGNKNVAAFLLPERFLSEEFRTKVELSVSRNAVLYERIGLQIGCPLEPLYRDGSFSGLLVTYMADGNPLVEFLEHASADKEYRIRVSCNFCSVVLLAGRAGVSLGRIDPNRVFVDEESCRVFLVPDIPSVLLSNMSRGREGSLSDSHHVDDNPTDIALLVYALMHGSRCSDLLKELWDESIPSSGLMASKLLQSLHKPALISLLDRLNITSAFEGPFWSDPPELRRLFERHFCQGRFPNAYQTAYDFFEALEKPRGAASGCLTELLEKLKRMLAGGGIQRDAVIENEKRAIGSRSITQPYVFWMTTIACSAALGLFSTLNGFSPLDPILNPNADVKLPEAASEVTWQFIPAAIAGSVLFNLLFAKRNQFVGHKRESYCWSLLAGMLFMSLSRMLFGGSGGY